jgi:hypothetical protein
VKRHRENRKARRWKAEAGPEAGTAGRRRDTLIRIGLSLSALFLMQLIMAWGTFRGPFLDTRMHYSYDNAFFTSAARDGNLNGDLKSQFGVTRNTYSRWGDRSGPPSYYTDHPFLMKAFFQQLTRAAGYGEHVSRIFSLAISFGIAAGLFAIVLGTTGSTLAAFASASVLVNLPLFATFQTTVNFLADGMLLGVWQFAALLWSLRRPSRNALAALALLTVLAFMAHWTAALYASFTGIWMAWELRRRQRPEIRSSLLTMILAGTAGLLLLLGLMVFLQGGVREAWAPLAAAVGRRASPIPLSQWLGRQWNYARVNFTIPLLVVLSVLTILAGVRCLQRRGDPSATPASGERDLLWVFIGVTLATACGWLFLFRQGSFVHVYWQYWFALPAAALVGKGLAAVQSRRRGLIPAAFLMAVLVLYLRAEASEALSSVRAAQLGTAEDIAFLASLRDDRFSSLVFIPYDVNPLNVWFEGPLFEYYTDRPVLVAEPSRGLRPGEKVLLLDVEDRQRVLADIAAQTGFRLANEKCGSRLCAYDVMPLR